MSQLNNFDLDHIKIDVPEKFSTLERCLLAIMETNDIVEIYQSNLLTVWHIEFPYLLSISSEEGKTPQYILKRQD